MQFQMVINVYMEILIFAEWNEPNRYCIVVVYLCKYKTLERKEYHILNNQVTSSTRIVFT